MWLSLPLSVLLQCPQVHASCSDEVAGEYAHAVGADQGRAYHLPHHGRHHLCQRDSLGCGAYLLGSVGVSVCECVHVCVCVLGRGGKEREVMSARAENRGESSVALLQHNVDYDAERET